MSPSLNFILLASLIPALFSVSSYLLKLITKGGAVAVFLASTGAYFGLGLGAFAYVAIVFSLSSFATLYRYAEKLKLKAAESNHGARTFRKVIGAAGPGGIIGWAVFLGWIPALIGSLGFAASIATITSDTWASEFGILSRKEPRMILHPRQKVSPGISGAVSLRGELASLSGAVTSIAVAYYVGLFQSSTVAYIAALACFSAALISEHLDSALGGSIQEAYRCDACDQVTDKRVHECGKLTVLVRGSRLVTNTAVNFISTLIGGLLAPALFYFFLVL